MPDPIIRVGIAGFGMSGRLFHAPFLHADSRFAITKVYERTTQRAREEYPDVEIVRSFAALLTEEIDLVVITAPNALHVPMARQAILAGKHVIVEKPIAATAAEAQGLCDLAAERGVLLSVYQNRRLDGDFLTVKRLIEGGALGEVLDYVVHFDRYVTGRSSKKWKADGGPGVNILYDLGVHIIDQAYTLFGMPGEVYADFRKQREETKDFDSFQVNLYYPRTKAILCAGQVVAMPGPHFMVHGRTGSFLKYGMDVQEAALVRGLRPPMAHWGQDSPERYGTLTRVMGGAMQTEPVATTPGNYGAYYDNIYRALTAGERLLVEPAETVDVLRIMETAQKSAETGRRVPCGAAAPGR